MKLITFAIPCYNSEAYMEHAIHSILTAGEDIEILVVNDGSKDRTSEIGHEYEKKYEGIVRVIDKENGGHGDAVMSGLGAATGKYFKVVDSDDWLDKSSLEKIMETLWNWEKDGTEVDMLLANYVYEKVGATRKKVVHYRNALPQNQVFSWDETSHFRVGQYILMHSVIYRTDLLRECGLTLPKHTFYVDNIYVYYPLPHVKTMYYIDTNLYRYFIGREDQSVNEAVMVGRVDQQIFVTKTMIDMYQMPEIKNPRVRKYMMNYLAIMMMISSILLVRAQTPEALEKRKDLWEYLKKSNYWTYWKIRYGIVGQSSNLPGKGGRRISIIGYHALKRIIGFSS